LIDVNTWFDEDGTLDLEVAGTQLKQHAAILAKTDRCFVYADFKKFWMKKFEQAAQLRKKREKKSQAKA